MGASNSCAPSCTLTLRDRQQHHPHQQSCIVLENRGQGEEDHRHIQQRFLFTGHNVSSLVLKADTIYTKLSFVSGYF